MSYQPEKFVSQEVKDTYINRAKQALAHSEALAKKYESFYHEELEDIKRIKNDIKYLEGVPVENGN